MGGTRMELAPDESTKSARPRHRSLIVSGQNKRGHHFVWPAICCSSGFVRALGFGVTVVTLRATPVGSWGPWAFAEPFVQSSW